VNEVDPEGGFFRTNALIFADAVIVNDCAADRSNSTSFATIDGDATASEYVFSFV